jgi:hypothetical protein
MTNAARTTRSDVLRSASRRLVVAFGARQTAIAASVR